MISEISYYALIFCAWLGHLKCFQRYRLKIKSRLPRIFHWKVKDFLFCFLKFEHLRKHPLSLFSFFPISERQNGIGCVYGMARAPILCVVWTTFKCTTSHSFLEIFVINYEEQKVFGVLQYKISHLKLISSFFSWEMAWP